MATRTRVVGMYGKTADAYSAITVSGVGIEFGYE